MNRARFDTADTWPGGCYGLALEFQHATTPTLPAAVAALQESVVDRWYKRNDVSPEYQERVRLKVPDLMESHLYALARTGTGDTFPCGVRLATFEEGCVWMYFYIPIGALEGVFDLGGFPFVPSKGGWRRDLDEWFFKVAQRIYGDAPFSLGVLGHEAPGEYDAQNISREVPSERELTLLVPRGPELVLYPYTVE